MRQDAEPLVQDAVRMALLKEVDAHRAEEAFGNQHRGEAEHELILQLAPGIVALQNQFRSERSGPRTSRSARQQAAAHKR